MHFDKMHKLRPQFRNHEVPCLIDDEEWVKLERAFYREKKDEITLTSDDGDDIDYWLEIIHDEEGFKWGERWTWK
jgi:hypothetical protein